MPLWRWTSLYQHTRSAAHRRASARSAKPALGNSGRYLAVRNSDSAKALSSLTRGRECDGATPSHWSMASTVVPFTLAPLSPCRTGRRGRAWMPSANAVRRTRWAACSAWSVSCTSKPTTLRLKRSRIRAEVQTLEDLAQGHALVREPAVEGAHQLGLVLVHHQMAGHGVVTGHVAVAVGGVAAEVVAIA